MTTAPYALPVQYEALYTDLDTAYGELMRRRNSRDLMHAVHRDLQLTSELDSLAAHPHALVFRQVATPIHDILHTLQRAHDVGLSPFILEYHKDKFVSTGNPFKRGLGKLPISAASDFNTTCAYRNRTIVDFNTHIGKSLDEVRTVRNELLIPFHHECFEYVTGIPARTISGDGTSWFRQWGNNAHLYYKQLLKIFIRDAILFEVFITSKSEEQFARDVVYPAFSEVKEEYGLAPLIVRIASDAESQSHYWNCYPNSVHSFLDRKGYS